MPHQSRSPRFIRSLHFALLMPWLVKSGTLPVAKKKQKATVNFCFSSLRINTHFLARIINRTNVNFGILIQFRKNGLFRQFFILCTWLDRMWYMISFYRKIGIKNNSLVYRKLILWLLNFDEFWMLIFGLNMWFLRSEFPNEFWWI